MNSRAAQLQGLALLLTLAGVGPASALAAEPADLPALEKAWHGCVREAYDRQPERGSRPGRERNALDECKPHEDRYVAALMAARPDADLPLGGQARMWTAYVSFVVDPVKAWIEGAAAVSWPPASGQHGNGPKRRERPLPGAQLHGAQPGTA
jgi:hypothetical protein